MTFRSGRISAVAFPPTRVDLDLPSYPSRADTVERGVWCTPQPLAVWARRHGLLLGGPDNCWIRVYADAEQVREFFQEFDLELPTRIAEHQGESFIIEAEEF